MKLLVEVEMELLVELKVEVLREVDGAIRGGRGGGG